MLNHQNLVKLIGYCLEDDHRKLVYEFMPRGSLENHLFRRSSYFQPLSWNLRIKVALGAAKGLAYLHSPEAKSVKISLKDCLACSGCITSAEPVMLEKQSLDEFLSNMNNQKAVIVSLSPQSRASIALHYGLSPLQVFRKLTTLFKSVGVKAVFDTSCSRDLSLIESCNEFISRYKQSCSDDTVDSKSSFPLISSACPEKTLGSYVLPYISSVKSPQQSIGAIIKHDDENNLNSTLQKMKSANKKEEHDGENNFLLYRR